MTSALPRSIQISMLEDDHGISEQTWYEVREYLDEDIYNTVHATNGRYYLPENWEAK